jgi:phosphoglycolate phosphatase-like HAD superfamily hydrolase
LIGDDRYDVECARRAGVDVAHFSGGNLQSARIDAPLGADHILYEYRDFFSVIDL